MVQIPIRSERVSVSSTAPTLTPSSTLDSTISPSDDTSAVTLTLHPAPSHQGLIAKVQPPHAPASPSLPRTPCDIVLVIDVSSSMGMAAPIPGGADEPNYGFSVLDLTRHAALTILETLDEGDRLGIVAFCSYSKVLRKLHAVDKGHKEACRKAILNMRPESATNLWGGIKDGLKLFEGEGEGEGRNPALLVLTDGMPNVQCPPQGYVPKLRQMQPMRAAIHTFGFGHSLRSGLLKSIADVGGGSYNYIPDSSMLGTVFIHAVANLQSTYANNATLKLRYPSPSKLPFLSKALELEAPDQVLGLVAAGVHTAEVEEGGRRLREVTVHLGALQYGQSRDLFIRAKNATGLDDVEATLTYSRMTPAVYALSARPAAPLPPAEEAYHVSRSQVLAALGSVYRLNSDCEYTTGPRKDAERQLSALPKSLPAAAFPSDARNASLLAELDASGDGQILLAASNEYFTTWGAHYLLGLKSAHERQACNSFKDRGPLMYGVDSPLFVRCRDVLDGVFDTLKAPKGSLHTTYEGPRDMSSYRSVSGPCFAGGTTVRVSGGEVVKVEEVKRGMVVATPTGERRVEGVLKTVVEGAVLCRVGDVLVTPWHPVCKDGSWDFPAEIAEEGPVQYTGATYSVLLEDGDSEGHAIAVGSQGLWGVTLGHGVLEGEDVRAHAFLGDHAAVKRELEVLGENSPRDDGVVVGGGVKRDGQGLVCGFERYVPAVKTGMGACGGGEVEVPQGMRVAV